MSPKGGGRPRKVRRKEKEYKEIPCEMVISAGKEVEVSSNEEGFKGAWYKATILRAFPTRGKGTALVRYQTLLADDSETNFLEEYVKYSFIRPSPPLDLEDSGDDRSFEEQDVVDAFDKDGWWKGVVAKVRVLEDNSRIYTVVFNSMIPPEEIEYPPSLLRFHLDWVNGQWVRPPKAQKRMEGLIFSRGMAAEVNIDKEGVKYGWIPATVLGEVGFDSFLVECNTLIDSDKSGPMEVTVDSFHIRPPAPDLEVKEFKLLDKVDAFCGCGWMCGLITKIFTEGRYAVFIRDVNEEKELIHSDIRPLLKFEKGNWVVFSGSKEMTMEAYLQGKLGRVDSADNFDEVFLIDEENTEDETPCQNSEKSPSQQSDNCHTKYKRKNAKQSKPDSGAMVLHLPKKAKRDSNTKCVSPEELVQNDSCYDICSLHVPELNIHGVGDKSKSQEGDKHSQQKAEDNATRGGARGQDSEDCASEEVELPTMKAAKPIGEENNAGRDGGQNDAVMGDGGGIEDCTTKEAVLPATIEHIGIEWGSSRMDSEGCRTVEELVQSDSCYDICSLHVPELDIHGEGDKSKSQEGDKHSQQKAEEKATRGVARGQDSEDCASEEVELPAMKSVKPIGEENNAGRDSKQMEDCTSKQNDAFRGGGGGIEDCTTKEVGLHAKIGAECEHIGIESGSSRMDSEGCRTIDIELPTTTIVEPIVGVGDGANGMNYEECATEDVESPDKIYVEHVGEENNIAGPGGSGMDFKSCVMEEVGVSKSIRVKHIGSERIVTGCSTSKMQFADCGGTKEDELPVKTSLESVGNEQIVTGHGAGEIYFEHRGTEDIELLEGTELIMEGPEIPETTTFVPGGDFKEVAAKNELVEDRMPFVKESSSIWEAVESLEVFQALPQRPHFRPLFECKESVREGLAIGHMVTFSQLAEKIPKLRVSDSQETFHCHLDSLADLEVHGFDITSLGQRLNMLLSIKDKREKLQDHFQEVQTQIVECFRAKAKLDEDIDNIDKKMRKLQEEREKKCHEMTALEMDAGVTNADISNADDEFEKVVAANW